MHIVLSAVLWSSNHFSSTSHDLPHYTTLRQTNVPSPSFASTNYISDSPTGELNHLLIPSIPSSLDVNRQDLSEFTRSTKFISLSMAQSDEKAILRPDFRGLLQNPVFSDLTLKCGEEHFKVHRCIVCPRSFMLTAACSGEFQVKLPISVFLSIRSGQSLRVG